MRHRILWALSAGWVATSLMLGACASSPSAPAARTSATTPHSSTPKSQRDTPPDAPGKTDARARGEARHNAPSDISTPQDGPIDLGMDDGQSADDEPVVIHRPTTASGPVALDDPADSDSAPLTHTYEQACGSADDCSALDPPECDGEMQCENKQCVYVCEADQAEQFDEGDAFDPAGEPLDDAAYEPAADDL